MGKEWDDLDKLSLKFKAAGLTLQATVGHVLVAMYCTFTLFALQH